MSLEETIESIVRRVVREELERLHSKLAPTTPGDDSYLSIRRAAEFADVHADTIRSWITAGRLPQHRAGRELRVLRSELRAFLDAGLVDARPTAEEEARELLARRRG